jgi:hypothetical protein
MTKQAKFDDEEITVDDNYYALTKAIQELTNVMLRMVNNGR